MKKFSGCTILLLVLLLMSCDNILDKTDMDTSEMVSKATESRYSEMEIREYNGIKLDPSVGPRDNSIRGIQNVDIENYTLKVTGLVNKPVSLIYDDVLNLNAYEKMITLYCVEGWNAKVLWKGVMLKEIIDMAEADESANTVIFHCADGYTTSMPLRTIIDRNMILAYSSNNITLPPSLGYPFIVVAEDKLGYKWARWVNEIELSNDKDYLGYWERNGYNNDAEIK